MLCEVRGHQDGPGEEGEGREVRKQLKRPGREGSTDEKDCAGSGRDAFFPHPQGSQARRRKLGMTGPGSLGSLRLDSQIPRGLWGKSQVLGFVFPSESAQRAIAKVAARISEPTSFPNLPFPPPPPPGSAGGWGWGAGWALCLHQRSSIILRGRVTPCRRPAVHWEEKLLSDKKAPFQAGPGVWAAPLCTVTLPQCQPHKHVGLQRPPPPSKGLVLTL